MKKYTEIYKKSGSRRELDLQNNTFLVIQLLMATTNPIVAIV